MKLEVLMSIMNIKNEEQLKNKINQNNITTDVLVINQVENNEDIFEFENIRCFSMNEKGASKSRNNLMRLAKGDICIFAVEQLSKFYGIPGTGRPVLLWIYYKIHIFCRQMIILQNSNIFVQNS